MTPVHFGFGEVVLLSGLVGVMDCLLCLRRLAMLGINLPEIKFFEEMDLIVFIAKFRENLPVVPEVVDHVQECLTIPIQEDLIIDLFELMASIEHLF